MSHRTASIINRSLNATKDKYNILTFDTHERYQTQLCKTGHNFYSFRYDNCKEWDNTYAELPGNYYILPKNSLISGIEFDFILTQSKFGQFQVASQINQTLNIPIISLEHTLPIPSWPQEQLQAFRSMVGDINLFISEYSIDQWKMNCDPRVIHHSVDTELFSPTEERKGEPATHAEILSVVNDFKNRDYCCNYNGWKRVTEGFEARLLGTCSEGLSKPAESIEDLVLEYNTAKVFLNTSTISPVPTSLLEAMSCGCAVVSTATCMIPEIIENGVNGFMSNDEEELKKYIHTLLGDEHLRKSMGQEARKTVIENFSEESFINNWNKTFDIAYGVKK
tara:strand:- start:13423 stop:14430 length:1008 start_codon:yes stop_codon:yes gene_type:complete